MGRYLERAAHLCRLLRLQTQALVDRSEREIGAGWRRIYRTMNRVPPLGEIEATGDDFILADSFTLADDLTFERIQSRLGVELLRHGARERAADASLHQCRDVDPPQPGLPAHSGSSASATSGGGHRRISTRRPPSRSIPSRAWRRPRCTAATAGAFLQLGRVVERAQSTRLALLLLQLAADGEQVEDREAEWNDGAAHSTGRTRRTSAYTG